MVIQRIRPCPPVRRAALCIQSNATSLVGHKRFPNVEALLVSSSLWGCALNSRPPAPVRAPPSRRKNFHSDGIPPARGKRFSSSHHTSEQPHHPACPACPERSRRIGDEGRRCAVAYRGLQQNRGARAKPVSSATKNSPTRRNWKVDLLFVPTRPVAKNGSDGPALPTGGCDLRLHHPRG